jgi:hypothetical protein
MIAHAVKHAHVSGGPPGALPANAVICPYEPIITAVNIMDCIFLPGPMM